MVDHPLKGTCTTLTTLLHAIHAKKKDGITDEDMVADAMALFGQLAGQHHNVMKEAEMEYEKIYDLRSKCEDSQSVLEEQLSYITYMDTEYDVRPWKADDVIEPISDSATHAQVKQKLDAELIGRREMCDYANSLEDQVSSLRKSEQEMKAELERLRKVMVSISTPAFLEGVSPCGSIPDAPLTGPLYTLHQMLSSSIREFPGISLSVTSEDPLLSNPNTHYIGRAASLPESTWSLLAPDTQLVVLCVGGDRFLVLRHHPKINIISCDDSLPSQLLPSLSPGDDGTVVPHPSLSFTFTGPTLPELVASRHIGRVFCWLQELAGLTVITEKQRRPSSITTLKFLQHLLK